MRRTQALMMTALLVSAGACDKKEKAEAENKPAAATPPAQGQSPAAEAPTNPHGAAPANPHAGMGHAAKMDFGKPQDVKPSGETTKETLAEFELEVPKEWNKQTPTSSMRLAQFEIPGPGGNAELVVFRFPGGAGGVEANLERWKKQFTPPEGKTLEDVSKVENLAAGDMKITLLDVQGRYVAAVMPGAPDQYDVPEAQMLAAIVEGQGDPFFFKLVGPQKTTTLWADPFKKMLQGLSATKK